MAHSSAKHSISPQTSNSASLSKQTLRGKASSSTSFSKESNLVWSKLPDTAHLLYTVLGDKEVLHELLQHFGGHTLRIPTRWPPHGETLESTKHPLRQVLEPKHMQNMVHHFGGTEVYIPKCNKYLCHIRNTSIVTEFCTATRSGTSSGQAVQALAKQYQLSDRRIWGILKSTVQE